MSWVTASHPDLSHHSVQPWFLGYFSRAEELINSFFPFEHLSLSFYCHFQVQGRIHLPSSLWLSTSGEPSKNVTATFQIGRFWWRFMWLVFFLNTLLSQLQLHRSKHIVHNIFTNKPYNFLFHIIDSKNFLTVSVEVESTEVSSKLGQ